MSKCTDKNRRRKNRKKKSIINARCNKKLSAHAVNDENLKSVNEGLGITENSVGKSTGPEVAKTTAVLTVSFIIFGILLSKILGLVRDILFAKSFGTGIEADAFVSASRLPNLFFDFTLGAIVLSVFIPIFTEYMQKYGEKKSFEFANIFLNFILIISFSAVLVLALNSKFVIDVFAPGLEDGTKVLACRLFLIMIPVMVLTAVTYTFIGLLQAMDEFKIPALVSIVSNLVLIVYICFFNKYYGIYGMAFSFVIGWILQTLFLIPSLLKKGYRYSLIFNFKHKGLIESLKNSLPVLISTWVQPAAVAINMRYASFFGTGGVSALDYAYKLYLMIVGVISLGITNYIFPKLSKVYINNDEREFIKIITQSLKIILLIVLPMIVGVSFFSRHIIEIVYTGGEFDLSAVSATSSGLFYYSFGMIGSAFCEVLNKGFYAKKDGRTPMIVAVLSILFTLTFTIFFTKVYNIGIGGLALSNSIVITVTAVVSVCFFCKSCSNILNSEFLFFLCKSVLVNGLMFIFLSLFYRVVQGLGDILSIIVSAAVFLFLYVLLLYIFRFEEIKLIFEDIKKKRVKS